MAKIVIAGDAVVITSAIKLADLAKVEKYRPDALILKGGEDGKEPIFRVGVTSGAGRINKYGAEFGAETRDDEKLATLTMFIDGIAGNAREAVAEAIGTSILNLNNVEEAIPMVIAEIDAEKDAILENITVIQ